MATAPLFSTADKGPEIRDKLNSVVAAVVAVGPAAEETLQARDEAVAARNEALAAAADAQEIAAGEVIDDGAPRADRVWSSAKAEAVYGVVPARRMLVVIGTSTAQGDGASSPGASWAGRLGAALQAKGWEYSNSAVGATNTAYALANFDTQVTAKRPTHVLMSFALNNDGLGVASTVEAKRAVMIQYLENINLLAEQCRRIGAKVLVTGSFCSNALNAVDFTFVKRINKYLSDQTNFPYIDFLGACFDPLAVDGHWPAGYSNDTFHPNDAGHLSFFRAIPLSLFDDPALDAGFRGPPMLRRSGVRTQGSLELYALLLNRESMPESITVMLRIQQITGTTPNVGLGYFYLLNEAGLSVRLRHVNGVVSLVVGSFGIDAAGLNIGDFVNRHFAVRYAKATGLWSLFVNGVKVGDTVDNTAGLFTSTPTIGNLTDQALYPTNTFFQELASYRIALTDAQIREAAAGNYYRGGLDVLSPLDDVALSGGIAMRNMSPTTSQAVYREGSTAAYLAL